MRQRQATQRVVRLAIGCVGCLLLAGFGCHKPKETAKVAGKITYKGEPIQMGRIYLLSDDGGYDWAEIRSGTFLLSQAPIGRVRVSVTGRMVEITPEQAAEGKARYIQSRQSAKGDVPPEEENREDPALVPSKFGNANTSGLVWDIQPGSQQKDQDLQP
jgi:hypothetical protein